MKKFLLPLIAIILLGAGCNNNSEQKAVSSKSPQEIAIESKGLAEFSAENNIINTVTPEDKKLAEETMPIFKLMGNGKDIAKNKEAVSALGKIIEKYPEYSDAYFLRATISVLVGDNDYQKILTDIDNAIRLHPSTKYKSAYGSTAGMYSLRAKVDILSGEYQQAINDIEIAIKTDPSSVRDVFNTGGIKPEDDSNPTALQKKDLDLLVAKYPDDYRTYMFRGLFYSSFTFFNKQQYCALPITDLQKAASINPNAAIIQYFLGKEQACDLFSTVAKASDYYRDQVNAKSLEYFKNAVQLDSKFTEAYAQIAEDLYSLKRYAEAIPYYDKVIELKPDDAGALSDRGLSKTYTNDYYSAIDDFSKAIELDKTNPSLALGPATTYENRAVAYVKATNYDSAIKDYSKAIGSMFASEVFLMSVPQIRTMYPEFNDITDENLLEGLRQKFAPNMSSVDFANNYKHDLVNSGEEKQPNKEFVLGDLYTSRGDTYLLAGNFKNAAKDYARAIYEGSTSIIDRWRTISKNSDTEYFIDAQTIDFGQGNLVSLWVKILNTNTQNYSQQNYQIDCSGRKIKSISGTNYNYAGDVAFTSPTQDWQTIVPESIGEILYNGMCSK